MTYHIEFATKVSDQRTNKPYTLKIKTYKSGNPFIMNIFH